MRIDRPLRDPVDLRALADAGDTGDAIARAPPARPNNCWINAGAWIGSFSTIEIARAMARWSPASTRAAAPSTQDGRVSRPETASAPSLRNCPPLRMRRTSVE